jgi:hypothetical protein
VNSWYDFDAHLWEVKTANCRPIINIQRVAKFASSRETLVWKGAWFPDSVHYGDSVWQEWQGLDTSLYCAPRGLLTPLYSDSNYWSSYILALMTHRDTNGGRQWPDSCPPCSLVHIYEIWNEVNDTCTDSRHFPPFGWATGWWRRPTDSQYGSGFDSLEGLCRLYVQMAWVAETVIHLQDGHANDTILITGTHRVFFESDEGGVASGLEFIKGCYAAATAPGGHGVFWDGVSIHPYQQDHGFSPDSFELMAESVRAVARSYGDYDCQVWSTEVGILNYGDWNDPSQVQQFYQGDAVQYLPQLYTTALASQALPGGRYDQCQWWHFATTVQTDSYGMIGLRGFDPETTGTGEWHKFASYHTYRQLVDKFTGLQFDQRILVGDSAQDNTVRLYQFSDPATGKRTFAGWVVDPVGRNDTMHREVKVPVMTDGVLAVGSDTFPPPSESLTAGQDGWLRLSLTNRAVYMIEASPTASRPDLQVDSVWYSATQARVYARAVNRGGRRTPRSPTGPPYPTWAVLTANGDSIAQNSHADTIGVNQSVTFSFQVPTPSLTDTVLLGIRVNPAQSYVELGTDDNAGYLLKLP